MEKKDKGNQKRFNIAVVALSIAALLLGALYLSQVMPKPYTAVIMANGDVYFGVVSKFPRLTISNVYTFQVVEDPENPGQSASQIVPLELLVWAPKALVLNRDYVVSMSRISEQSEVMRLIRGNN